MNIETAKCETAKANSRAVAKTKGRTLFSKKPATADLSPEDRELIRVTLEARDEWAETNDNFEHVHEDLLVDYYTYKIKACEARYAYFLKLVKEKELVSFLGKATDSRK